MPPALPPVGPPPPPPPRNRDTQRYEDQLIALLDAPALEYAQRVVGSTVRVGACVEVRDYGTMGETTLRNGTPLRTGVFPMARHDIIVDPTFTHVIQTLAILFPSVA